MINLGDYKYGDTIYVPFQTFNSAGASVTITGLLASDVEIFKNGSVTQRASDNGYTLLDTDGIDLDGITGIHGFSIDTADNSTAGFWAPNSEYFLVVSAITVDAQTVNFVCKFTIEKAHDPKVLLRTDIATLASQTSFTLTAGSADNDAYNGCMIVVQDAASVVQKALGVVGDYTGATKTITMQTDPGVFTMAVGDYVTVLADKAAAVLDLADSIETGLTLRQALRLIASTTAGKLSGAGTATETFRNAVADSKNRVVATVDGSGNRTVVTTDVT